MHFWLVVCSLQGVKGLRKGDQFCRRAQEIFAPAYPSEAISSAILLQRFLTGLQPSVTRQLLQRGQLQTLDSAVKGRL